MNDIILDLPETPIEKDYLIVYIDILGTKERLAQKDVSEVFEKVYYPFLLAGKIAPIIERFNLMDICIKIFSDNILFAYPIEHCSEKEEILDAYNKLGRFLKIFLSMFARNGILFRGAMTINKLYINELMVWGKGLLTVVDLEENVAIYPRIILSEELLMVFGKYGCSGVEFEEKFSCLTDMDDCVFFDFFNYFDKDIKKTIQRTKTHICQMIETEKAGKNRPRILQKYYWFRNYLFTAERILSEIQSNT